jgi:hypothetical protein
MRNREDVVSIHRQAAEGSDDREYLGEEEVMGNARSGSAS